MKLRQQTCDYFFPFSTLVTCEMALFRNSDRIRNIVVAHFTKKSQPLYAAYLYI